MTGGFEMAVNPCIYCGAEVPEGYGHACTICETNIKNGVMPRNAVPAISAGCGQVPRNRKFKPIYKPSGRAHEYGEYAINIYSGCDNGCYYCYAPKTLHTDRAEFERVKLRFGIVKAVWEQLSTFPERGKTIALCFTCDPYPRNIDSTPTRNIIQAIKNSGNHVQILTKNPISRDFDIMDKNDWFGITLTCNDIAAANNEPGALPPTERVLKLYEAHRAGLKTWISLEPVISPEFCYGVIQHIDADLYRIGKLNYYHSEIDWKQFGRKVEELCVRYRRNYYIKEDLRKEMQG